MGLLRKRKNENVTVTSKRKRLAEEEESSLPDPLLCAREDQGAKATDAQTKKLPPPTPEDMNGGCSPQNNLLRCQPPTLREAQGCNPTDCPRQKCFSERNRACLMGSRLVPLLAHFAPTHKLDHRCGVVGM